MDSEGCFAFHDVCGHKTCLSADTKAFSTLIQKRIFIATVVHHVELRKMLKKMLDSLVYLQRNIAEIFFLFHDKF